MAFLGGIEQLIQDSARRTLRNASFRHKDKDSQFDLIENLIENAAKLTSSVGDFSSERPHPIAMSGGGFGDQGKLSLADRLRRQEDEGISFKDRLRQDIQLKRLRDSRGQDTRGPIDRFFEEEVGRISRTSIDLKRFARQSAETGLALSAGPLGLMGKTGKDLLDDPSIAISGRSLLRNFGIDTESVVAEEVANPVNIATGLLGGPLSAPLRRSPHRLVRGLGEVIAPFGSRTRVEEGITGQTRRIPIDPPPFRSIASEIAAGLGYQTGREVTGEEYGGFLGSFLSGSVAGLATSGVLDSVSTRNIANVVGESGPLNKGKILTAIESGFKSGNRNSWERHFKNAGLTDEEISLAGIRDVFEKSGKDKFTKQDFLENLFKEEQELKEILPPRTAPVGEGLVDTFAEAINNLPERWGRAKARTWTNYLKRSGMTERDLEITGLNKFLSDPDAVVDRQRILDVYEDFLNIEQRVSPAARIPDFPDVTQTDVDLENMYRGDLPRDVVGGDMELSQAGKEYNPAEYERLFEYADLTNRAREGTITLQEALRLRELEAQDFSLDKQFKNIIPSKEEVSELSGQYNTVKSAIGMGPDETLPAALKQEPRLRPEDPSYRTVKTRLEEIVNASDIDETIDRGLRTLEDLRLDDLLRIKETNPLLGTTFTGDPRARARELLESLTPEELNRIVAADDWDEAFRRLVLIDDYKKAGFIFDIIKPDVRIDVPENTIREAIPANQWYFAKDANGNTVINGVPKDIQADAITHMNEAPVYRGENGITFTEVLDFDEPPPPRRGVKSELTPKGQPREIRKRPTRSKLAVDQERFEGRAQPRSTTGRVQINEDVSIPAPPTVEDAVAGVNYTDNETLGMLLAKTGINKVAAMQSNIGRLLAGYIRAQEMSKHLVNAASRANIDVWATKNRNIAQRFWQALSMKDVIGPSGSLFQIDNKGIVKNNGLNVHWLDIYENVNRYADQLNNRQLKFINEYHALFDSINNMLIDNGLEPLQRNVDGKYLIPRSVKSIFDIDIGTHSDHFMRRLYDTATEAVAQGVEYANPRDTFAIYLATAYRTIIDKRWSDELAKVGYSSDDLISEGVKKNYYRYQEITEGLRSSLREINQQLVEDPTNASLKNVKDKLLKDYEQVRPKWREARAAYHNAKQALQSRESGVFDVEGDKVLLKKWTNSFLGHERFFDAKDWEFLRDIMGYGAQAPRRTDKSTLLGAIEFFPNTMRLLSTGFDLGTPLIQGLPTLAYRPNRWAQAVFHGYRAFFNPNKIPEFYKNNLDEIAEMIKAGVPMSDEAYKAIEDARFAGRIARGLRGKPGVGVLSQGSKQTLQRFQSHHNHHLTMLRFGLWKSLKDQFDNKAELGAFIANLTGGLDQKMLGIGEGQRTAENLFLALSPRLFRSTIALLGMAGKGAASYGTLGRVGTVADRKALHALAAMSGFMIGSYYLAGLLFNKDEEEILEGLKPWNGKRFLSHQIGPWNEHIGWGGQFRAIAQMVGNVGKTLNDGDYETLVKFDWYENPFIAYWTGRSALGTRVGGAWLEAFFDVDTVPYEEIRGPEDAAFFMIKSSIPFSAVGASEGEKIGAAWGFIGGRSSPETFSEKRDRRSQEEYGKPYEELNREEKRKFNQAHPSSRSAPDDNVTTYFDELERIELEFIQKVSLLEARTLVGPASGGLSKQEFREAYNELRTEKFDKIEQLQETFSRMPANRFDFEGSVIDYINQGNLQPEDQAVQEWYNLYEKAIDDNLQFDFDKLEDLRESFLETLDHETKEYVLRNTKSEESFSKYGVVDEYERVKDLTEPYFEANNMVFDELKSHIPFLKGFEDYDAFVKWIDTQAAEYGITGEDLMYVLGKAVPEIEVFNKVTSTYKRVMRLADPNLDRALVEWYGYAPANRAAYVLGNYGIEGGEQLAPGILSGDISNSRTMGVTSALLAQSQGLQPTSLDTSRLGRVAEASERYAFTPLRSQLFGRTE